MMKSTKFFIKTIFLTFIFVLGRGVGCSEVQAQIKQFWGMTSTGGQYGLGTIFKTDSSGNNQSIQYSFSSIPDGDQPNGSLMLSNDGKLYGMTQDGGVYDSGILFQYDPTTSSYTKKLDFAGTTNGQYPYGSLIQASDGKLYGMTHNGGTSGLGVLFQYDPFTSTYVKKVNFAGSTNGANPTGSLMQASDGKLYGMTGGGGVNNTGVLFQYDPVTSICTKKLDFVGVTNGEYPYGFLTQAIDGKLYGMTIQGGANSMGVLFQYDPVNSSYTKKLDFSGSTDGKYPYSSLIQASDGKLYGMTSQGGVNGMGVLFQYNPTTSSYIKKLDFAGATNGSSTSSSLMQANNGKLYGMTIQGGTNNNGVLFEYDPITSTYAKKLDFAGATNGSSPTSNLIEITVNPVGIFSLEKELALKLYPNPAHDLLTIELLTANQKNANILIENMFGQVIYEAQIDKSIHKINTEHYARGIYLVKVKTNDGTSTKKIIVE